MTEKTELKMRRCDVLMDIKYDPKTWEVHGTWEECLFKDLKKGQIFRLFDLKDNEDDQIFEDGTSISVALEDAKPAEPEGNFAVNCFELTGWSE